MAIAPKRHRFAIPKLNQLAGRRARSVFSQQRRYVMFLALLSQFPHGGNLSEVSSSVTFGRDPDSLFVELTQTVMFCVSCRGW